MANENYLGLGVIFIVTVLALALGAAAGGFNPDGLAPLNIERSSSIGQKVCGTGGDWCPAGYKCTERTPQASYGLKTARYPLYCKPTPQNKAI
ncbi:MAG: hypothetical protein HYT16_00945 [DPANN group archaeon]|nr:hypothetical protein [DPANN group archaeon]